MKISQLDFSRYLNREGPLMQPSSYQQIHSSNELQGDKYRFRCSANISIDGKLVNDSIINV